METARQKFSKWNSVREWLKITKKYLNGYMSQSDKTSKSESSYEL